MRLFKFVLVVLISLSCILPAQTSFSSQEYLLPIEKSADEYACVIKGDTMKVVVYDFFDRDITIYDLVDDELLHSKTYNHIKIDDILCLTPDLKLYTPYAKIDLKSGQIFEYEPDIKDKDKRIKFEFVFPTANSAYLGYTDHTDVYFHIAPDKANREYTKFCVAEFDGTSLSEPVRNREGKIDCRNLHVLCNNDTVYAVWQEKINKKEIFMSGKFYDEEWFALDTIFITTEDQYKHHQNRGLFLINNTFYSFWHTYDENTKASRLYYKWSNDFINWGDDCFYDWKLPFKTYYDSNNGLLYLIDDYPFQINVSILDGCFFKIHNEIYQDKKLANVQIVFDEGGNPHLFWLVSYDKVYNQYAGTGGQPEKASLTRYALHHALLTDLIGE